MSDIRIAVSAADAAVTKAATLTGGMVGASVTFAFSGDEWISLRKIAVFRAGSVQRLQRRVRLLPRRIGVHPRPDL